MSTDNMSTTRSKQPNQPMALHDPPEVDAEEPKKTVQAEIVDDQRLPRPPLQIHEYIEMLKDEGIPNELVVMANNLAEHVQAYYQKQTVDLNTVPSRPTMVSHQGEPDDCWQFEIEMQWSYPGAPGKLLILSMDDYILITTPTIRGLFLPLPADGDPKNVGDFIIDCLRSM